MRSLGLWVSYYDLVTRGAEGCYKGFVDWAWEEHAGESAGADEGAL